MREKFDLIVLGSGAAGLTAALTAASSGSKVIVFEKSDQVGGTSAWSGGHVWIPNAPCQADVGIEDSADEAVEYLLSMSRGLMDESLVRAFVAAGPLMVERLEEVAEMGFYVCEGIPDYHPENPGAKAGGGRTIECPLFPYAELGEWANKVAVSPYYANPHLVMSETPTGVAVPPVVTATELERRKILDERGLGQGLIGRLLKGCLDHGVELRTSHRAVQLEMVDGAAKGVRIEDPDGESLWVEADRGVVIATGGFEWNEEYRRAFLRGPLTHPISIETNTGDGLYMAMKAGAMLGNMREAYWTTVADLPPGVNSRNRIMLSADRSRPRSIIVNKHGRRFANESANYNSFGGAFHQEDVARFDYANLPCWLIFDQEYLRRYGTIGWPASDSAPDWVRSFPSLEALANDLDIPEGALLETVSRWNAGVAEGADPDFGRGLSAHDRWWGDPNAKGSVYGSLGPLDTAPYYAIPVNVGAMGTKGGPRIDEHARVVDLDGAIIPGLYAAGNAMAAPYGMTYGGAGGTLGPAMVAGYLAGTHSVGKAGRN